MMPTIVTSSRAKLSPAQLELLARIERAETLSKRDVNGLRSLEHRLLIKLRRPGHETYPLDGLEYAVTDRGRSLIAYYRP